jgi:hypothetical protein
MITEIIEFAGFDGHLVPICISARNSRLHGDGCFDLLDKLEFIVSYKATDTPCSSFNANKFRLCIYFSSSANEK